MGMITKTQLFDSMGNLPENLSVEQIIEHLLFLEKVQKGLEDSKSGRVNTKEEAKQKLNKWLK
ncbi:MAG: hypothetical protein LPK45_12210 [Bacteroidota bacterium]|nr:hypothetical protein [Bacteroidota bacterium]MDX5431873.1 hypothetical protein [Bacteroidota bacterium]MDX5470587.1 hypothetical protein [Bacteroidota bacterium]